MLSILLKSELSDKIKRNFCQAVFVSILLYRCTTWTLTKRREKELGGNYTRMLRAILNKFWKQHSTKQLLCDHLPPISKTIQIRRAENCWRSKDEQISNVFYGPFPHGCASGWLVGWSFYFTAYQPISGHSMPFWISNNSF